MLRSLIVAVALSLATFAFAQNQPPSDPQAVSYAAKSIAALTGGTGINDANAATSGCCLQPTCATSLHAQL